MMERVIGGLLFVMLGLGVGGVFVVWGLYTAGSTEFTCQRVESNQVNCTITQYRWLGLSLEATELTQVEKARRDSYSCTTGSFKNKRTTTCYNLVIETKSGDIHPTNYIPTELANEINQFIASGQPTWTYKDETGEWMFGLIFAVIGAVMGPVFAIVGLIMMFGTPTQTSATKPQ